jgi:nickel superoxide dismutase
MFKSKTIHAHCDGPCGVYDPASARIAGEAVLSMTKKMLELKVPDTNDDKALLAYHNAMTRYIQIKEQEAQKCKDEILILWTDFFKPVHLKKYPNLHDLFWQTAKLCSSNKHEISLEHAQELMDNLKKIHTIFWDVKEKDVPWILAN